MMSHKCCILGQTTPGSIYPIPPSPSRNINLQFLLRIQSGSSGGGYNINFAWGKIEYCKTRFFSQRQYFTYRTHRYSPRCTGTAVYDSGQYKLTFF